MDKRKIIQITVAKGNTEDPILYGLDSEGCLYFLNQIKEEWEYITNGQEIL